VSTDALLSPTGQWLLLVALLAVWMIVVIDIVRRPGMRRAARLGWLVACTLIWPAQVLYLLVRPQRGRVEETAQRTDPHARLVAAVLERDSGRLPDDEWQERVRALRPDRS
jgi:hypothetical protein